MPGACNFVEQIDTIVVLLLVMVKVQSSFQTFQRPHHAQLADMQARTHKRVVLWHPFFALPCSWW